MRDNVILRAAIVVGILVLPVIALTAGGCSAERPHRGAPAAGFEANDGTFMLAEENVQVVLSAEKLRQYDLTAMAVQDAVIERINANSGSLTRQQLLATPVGTSGGKTILLSDVAELRSKPLPQPPVGQ